MRVLGVDGCRGGWIAACVDGEQATWRWTADVDALLHGDEDVVAIDIPIGLPDRGRRACDLEARALLGARRSTVFFAPVRPVVQCMTYAEARAELVRLGEPSMSAQAFGIVAAVRAVDGVVTRADEARLVEAHPELAFLRMTGAALPPKKSDGGRNARLAALRASWPAVDDWVAAAPHRGDDAIDALACAWVAQRWATGVAQVVGDGARDSRGLLMRIVS